MVLIMLCDGVASLELMMLVMAAVVVVVMGRGGWGRPH